MTRYEIFNREAIRLKPIAERGHDLTVENCLPLQAPTCPFAHADFPRLLERIRNARAAGRPVIWVMGAHPIKLGLSGYLVDLIQRGYITHLATNGAGIIHDFEIALLGGTSESVSRWIREGQFGLWRETSRLNEIIRAAADRNEGLGEAVGRVIVEEELPFADLSLCAVAYRARVPVTAHVTVGGDIIHPMENCSGAALGAASYTDFLIFARAVQDLEGGVFLNIGSAVTGPEVYLKALSMARNVARQQGAEIRRFTTAVFDLVSLPDDWSRGTPHKNHPGYYYRPWKTILIRTVADGGTSFFFQGDHQRTIPTLWAELVKM